MFKPVFILLLFSAVFSFAQENTTPDFKWGQASYYNMKVGEEIFYNGNKVTFLQNIGNHSQFKVENDTVIIKVAQRSLPHMINAINIYVADNANLKELDYESSVHGLLTKDVLVCLTKNDEMLLDSRSSSFPVAFNDGYIWSGEEDRYVFAFLKKQGTADYYCYQGIGLDMTDARGVEKHWIVAMEDCLVVWVEENENRNTSCVLLKSKNSEHIYYVYDELFEKNIQVKKGQELNMGELIGTAWGDENWGHVKIAVVYSTQTPEYVNRFNNVINFFPQLYQLYYNQIYGISRSFSKGKISFGRSPSLNRNVQNVTCFEDFFGKGWLLDKNNIAARVEWLTNGEEGNVRLSKTLFKGTKAAYTNPKDFYCYEINVPNGVYRIRAKVGDIEKESWQKISFEDVETKSFNLNPGVQDWTGEKVVRVTDHRLSIRVYVDPSGNKVAGLSELVFQQAY